VKAKSWLHPTAESASTELALAPDASRTSWLLPTHWLLACLGSMERPNMVWFNGVLMLLLLPDSASEAQVNLQQSPVFLVSVHQ